MSTICLPNLSQFLFYFRKLPIFWHVFVMCYCTISKVRGCFFQVINNKQNNSVYFSTTLIINLNLSIWGKFSWTTKSFTTLHNHHLCTTFTPPHLNIYPPSANLSQTNPYPIHLDPLQIHPLHLHPRTIHSILMLWAFRHEGMDEYVQMQIYLIKYDIILKFDDRI